MTTLSTITVQVPATSANCGPGFDTLGLACTLYNTFEFTLLPRGWVLEVEGEGKDELKAGPENLIFAAFDAVWRQFNPQPYGLKVKMHNVIPMSRGLGSSSSAIVGGLVAANVLCGAKLSLESLLALATDIEGHPDNVAPALYGGFTISYMQGRVAHTTKLIPQLPLQFIAVVPEQPLSTAKARAALPAQVPLKDAIFNCSRTGLLVAALLTGNATHLATALEDKLHQPYRAPLLPGLAAAMDAAKKSGAYNAIISGAGSTIMAYAPIEADGALIARAMVNALAQVGQKASYHLLTLDNEGARIVN